MKWSRFVLGLVGFGVVLVGVLLAWGAVQKSEPENYAVQQARTEATVSQLKNDQAQSQFWAIFWPGVAVVVVLLVIWAVVSEVRHRRRLSEVVTLAKVATLAPDHQGNYPARLLNTGELVMPNPGNIRFNVPNSINYNPHTIYRQEARQDVPSASAVRLLPDAGEEEDTLQLPPANVDLASSLKKYNLRTDRLEVLMGETARGPVIRPFGPDTLHFGTLGRTGSGKTAFTQSVLTTLALHDPSARMVQFGFIDPKRKIYKPFSSLNHVQFVATDDTQAMRCLGETMKQLKARMDLTRTELLTQPFKIIVIDEFLSLRRQLDKSGWNLLVSLLEQGREARLYFIFMGHAFYSDKDMRELRAQLTTRSLFAVEDLGTAAAFGFRDSQAVERLCNERRAGLYLMKSTTRQELVQAPYIDEESIPVLLGSGTSAEKVGNSGNLAGKTGNWVENSEKNGKGSSVFPNGSGSNFQNFPFSENEIEAFKLLIEGGEMGKTEIVKLMPGYSSREHKRFSEYYEVIQKIIDK